MRIAFNEVHCVPWYMPQVSQSPIISVMVIVFIIIIILLYPYKDHDHLHMTGSKQIPLLCRMEAPQYADPGTPTGLLPGVLFDWPHHLQKCQN